MSDIAMTPDQFFDELDKLFGTDDGYVNHLKRIKETLGGSLAIKNHPYPTKLRKENEELKKENAELKEQTEGIMNEEGTQHILGINAYEKFCQAMCELNCDEDMISDMKVEQNKLKKQNAELQTELDDEKEEHENTKYDLEKLKDELEPLDEMMEKIREVIEYEDVVDYVNGLHEKNLELEDNWIEIHERVDELIESLTNWRDNAEIVVPQKEHEKEIAELKEEIAELETSLQSTENYWKSNYENEQSTNKMLNDAIINHTEILDELRTYLSNFDGDEVEVFDKIVKGSTD